jgi:cyclic pyranopterin phosphate synthase
MTGMTHIDGNGKATMVDVSGKQKVARFAKARGFIRLSAETVGLVRGNALSKGDVLCVARIAGIQAAKRTSELIPLCHGISAEHIGVELTIRDDGIEIEASAACVERTGIEMEALTAVSVTALTIWDMCKAVDSSMRIESIELVEKRKEARA